MAQQDPLIALNHSIAAGEQALAQLRRHIEELRRSHQDTKEAEARLNQITKMQWELRDRREQIRKERARNSK